ncbi:MAG: hypothetical protein WAN74_02795 [Thermoplasmata archaeon]
MVAGLSDFTAATMPLGLVAIAMVGLNLYILHRLLLDRPRPPVSTFVLGVGVLVTQLVLWAGVGYYLFVPTVGGFVLFAIAAQFMMVPIGIWFVALILQQSRRAIVPGSLAVAVTIGLLLFANEYLMSIAFLPLAPPAFAGTIWFTGNPIEFLAAPLVTLWYCWPMGVTMAALLWWTHLPSADARAVGALTTTAFVAPWIPESPLAGAIATAVVMSVGLALLLRASLTDRRPTAHSARLRLGAALAFVLMSAGAFSSVLVTSRPWHVLPYASISAAVMIGETIYLVRSLLSSGMDIPEPAVVLSPVPSSGV